MLKVQLKPHTDVQALRPISTGEMQLVPLTDRLHAIKETDVARHVFVATVSEGSASFHFALNAPDPKRTFVHAFMLRHAVNDVRRPLDHAHTAMIEHVVTSVPFKAIGKTKATMVKVSVPVIKLIADVAEHQSITLPAKVSHAPSKRASAMLELPKEPSKELHLLGRPSKAGRH